jgi:hypothetical protein
MFYVLAKLFHKNLAFFVSRVKKQILVLKKAVHMEIFLFFLHMTQKYRFFYETWRAH